MRRILKYVLIFLVVVIVAALAAPFFIPVDTLKTTVISQLEAATGRKVSLDKLSLSLFPDIALSATDVKIGNAPWAGAGDMADIKTLRLGVALVPLLRKEVHVKELTLESPMLNLVKKGDQANWQFGKPQPPAQTPAVTPPSAASANGSTASLGGISLGKINIEDGSLTYNDLTAHTTQSLAQVDLSLEAPDPSEKATFDANAVYNGSKLHIELGASKPMGITSGKASDINLKASYGPMDLSWQGTLSLEGGIPNITGKVTIPQIDTQELQSFSMQQEKAMGGTPAPAAAPSSKERWSSAPIDLSGLKSVSALLTISIGKLVMPKTTLDNIVMNIHLQKGALSVETNDIAAYGGTAKVALTATTTSAVTVALSVDNVKAEPLLHDFASYDKLSGTLAAHAKLNTSGNSERAMVSALAGSGDFHLKNGSLKGINLASMARNIGSAFQSSNSESTDFSELSGTFIMKDGVATNNDLQLASPLLRVGGEGTADLPLWHVNYLLKPKIVASLQGQGSVGGAGITVPIRVEGALDNPGYKPDLQAALKENLANPAAVKDTVKGLGQNLLNNKNGGGLGGLLR